MNFIFSYLRDRYVVLLADTKRRDIYYETAFVINLKFSQKCSESFQNIPKILFKIYFKFPVNFSQDSSKIPLKFF